MSTAVCSSSAVDAGSLQHGLEGSSIVGAAFAPRVSLETKKPAAGWRQEVALANVGLTAEMTARRPSNNLGRPSISQVGVVSMLDRKLQASDVVMLDKYTQPVDRGPAAQRLMKSWQYKVTGKLAAAAVLTELKIDHIAHGEGEPFGIMRLRGSKCRVVSPRSWMTEEDPLTHPRRPAWHASRGLQAH